MYKLAALVVLLAAACGDNLASPDAATRGDGSTIDGAHADGSVASTAAIVAGDFTAGDPGVLASLDLHALAVTQGRGPTGAVGDDPLLRHFGDELFIINRSDGNNITILHDTTFALVEQLATGASSNPQDVAQVGTKLYVPTYGTSGVTVLTRGTTTTAQIDLSADDPDGKPNCESAIAVGTDVYVACQLLNPGFMPRGNGKIYVIDTAHDTVRTSFALTTKNPFSLLEQVGSSLAIGTVDFTDNSGCIETFAPGATPTATCAIANSALGGYAERLSAASATTAWVAVSDGGFPDPVETLDLVDLGAGTKTVHSGSGEEIGDVAACPDGSVVVSDVTTGSAGVRVFSGTGETTTAAQAIGLPPASQHGIECY